MGIVELLDKTGYKSYTEFMTGTEPAAPARVYERTLVVESIREYHRKRKADMEGAT